MAGDGFSPAEPLRLRHRRGERLLEADFADQFAQDDQLRWWHNRAVHHAYGVVEGFEVSEGDPVTVGPGLAYDRRGRELLLESAREVPASEGQQARYLVAEWGGRATEPTLRWVATSGARPLAVPLAVSDEGAPAFVPPRARAMARPHIARGATVVGAGWRPWGDPPISYGLEVSVDTSAGGFTGTPRYFAQLTGALEDPLAPGNRLVPYTHIAHAGKDGFLLRVAVQFTLPSPGLRAFMALTEVGDDEAGGDSVAVREAARTAAVEAGLAVTGIGIQQEERSRHELVG